MELDKYEPQPDWYYHLSHSGGDIHGISHAARVLVWADQIGRWMLEQGVAVDLEVVRWSASFHDVRRMNDGPDLGHGERAAQWIKSQAAQLPFALDQHQLGCLCYCCRWHVPDDVKAPEMTAELKCLKDADGLDRVRLFDLNVNYLRTPYAKGLVGQAKALFEGSQRNQHLGDWHAVRAAAIELNLWR